MGHIELACPVSHIWFLRGVPSRMGMILDVPAFQLEKVIYFASYIITGVNEAGKEKIKEEIQKEYKTKAKIIQKKTLKESSQKQIKTNLDELKKVKDKAENELTEIKLLKILSEVEYHEFSLKYGEVFEAGTGSETLRKIFENIDLKKEIVKMGKELEEATPQNRKKILRRLKLFRGMDKAKIRPEWMFLTILPILPPDLRPMVQLDGGRYASSDLNDLYRRVINRNSRLKYLLEINAPDVIIRNEKRMLQEAVDALIDNGMRKGVITQATTGGKRLLKSLADILKGKQGRFRQNLLGKRVDYSGRSVIVIGSGLKLNQCGIPKEMALELFKPFIIKKILEKELAYNVRGASRLIEEKGPEIWAILEEIVKDKLVLLNRAPTLHRLGIQAFQPLLVEGEAIQIHPMVCKAFNADFDGDQMAVHIPLSEEAQKEAREIMLSSLNLLKPATGTPIVTPTQDIILGCYWLNKITEGVKGEGKFFSNPEEAILAYDSGELDLKAKVKIRGIKGTEAKKKLFSEMVETSVGRVIFNEALPDDFPFQNEDQNGKKMEKVIGKIIEMFGFEETQKTLDRIKNLGFEYATQSGISWGMDDLIVPPEKGEIIKKAEKEVEQIEEHYKKGLLSKEEKTAKVIENWARAKSEIEKLLPKTLSPTGAVFQIIDSGARGSWAQPVQMAGMKGLVINPSGQIIELPVKSSYKEGFNVLEYFISTHGARKGTADTALRTSTAGYLTRRLVDVAHEMVVTEEDCGDKEGAYVLKADSEEIGQNFAFKIVGRVAAEDCRGEIREGKSKRQKLIVKKGEIIDWTKADTITEAGVEKVKIYSPLTCKAIRGLCQKCYGWDLGVNHLVKPGEAVGIVAAQAIGEPGTQLTMKTFHLGGVAGGAGDITFGLPRVQEIFEARSPGGKAEISQTEGRILDIKPEGIIRIKTKASADSKKSKSEIIEYKIPQKIAILVEPDQVVKAGQQLSEGSIDLKELFKFAGREETQHYVIHEIQKIYVSQGAVIHDKHIEVIVRQMFSRVRIKEAGDTSFTPGEIIERSKFIEENAKMIKEKKEPAKGAFILLGISRVSLTTNSFLSAASFQETSRVLIKASIEGKEDKLSGLKENVIIGKLIPAGTGFKKNEEKGD